MHEQPSLHGEAQLWGLAWAALDYIERTVQPGMATLETGAGASTMMFASRGAVHRAVTPSAGRGRAASPGSASGAGSRPGPTTIRRRSTP